MFGCRHRYKIVQANGYQYCEKCGIAIVAPCAHEWERIELVKVERWGNKVGHIYVDSCSKCLEIRKQSVHTKEFDY